jgi:uncharacterized membrane protein
MQPPVFFFVWIWSPFAILFGLFWVIFRQRVSKGIRENWRERQMKVGPRTQSPATVAAAGALFMVAGVGVLVGYATGVLRG